MSIWQTTVRIRRSILVAVWSLVSWYAWAQSVPECTNLLLPYGQVAAGEWFGYRLRTKGDLAWCEGLIAELHTLATEEFVIESFFSGKLPAKANENSVLIQPAAVPEDRTVQVVVFSAKQGFRLDAPIPSGGQFLWSLVEVADPIGLDMARLAVFAKVVLPAAPAYVAVDVVPVAGDGSSEAEIVSAGAAPSLRFRYTGPLFRLIAYWGRLTDPDDPDEGCTAISETPAEVWSPIDRWTPLELALGEDLQSPACVLLYLQKRNRGPFFDRYIIIYH